jgi:hypothetical protein
MCLLPDGTQWFELSSCKLVHFWRPNPPTFPPGSLCRPRTKSTDTPGKVSEALCSWPPVWHSTLSAFCFSHSLTHLWDTSRFGCFQSLGKQIRGFVEYVWTHTTHVQQLFGSNSGSCIQWRETSKVKWTTNTYKHCFQPTYNINPYTVDYKWIKIIFLYLCGYLDQDWCTEPVGECLVAELKT